MKFEGSSIDHPTSLTKQDIRQQRDRHSEQGSDKDSPTDRMSALHSPVPAPSIHARLPQPQLRLPPITALHDASDRRSIPPQHHSRSPPYYHRSHAGHLQHAPLSSHRQWSYDAEEDAAPLSRRADAYSYDNTILHRAANDSERHSSDGVRHESAGRRHLNATTERGYEEERGSRHGAGSGSLRVDHHHHHQAVQGAEVSGDARGSSADGIATDADDGGGGGGASSEQHSDDHSSMTAQQRQRRPPHSDDSSALTNVKGEASVPHSHVVPFSESASSSYDAARDYEDNRFRSGVVGGSGAYDPVSRARDRRTPPSPPINSASEAQSRAVMSNTTASDERRSTSLDRHATSMSPSDRPSLPPLKMMLSPHRQHEEDDRQRHASHRPGGSSEWGAARATHNSSMPPLQRPPSPTTGGGPARTNTFMHSLLRAAQSPSVPSLPPPGAYSANESSHRERTQHHHFDAAPPIEPHQRPRKRRTSSVQEPLQGSALEAAARAQSFPRLSEPTTHGAGGGAASYRGRAFDESMGRLNVTSDSPSMRHLPSRTASSLRGSSVGVAPHHSPSEHHAQPHHPHTHAGWGMAGSEPRQASGDVGYWYPRAASDHAYAGSHERHSHQAQYTPPLSHVASPYHGQSAHAPPQHHSSPHHHHAVPVYSTAYSAHGMHERGPSPQSKHTGGVSHGERQGGWSAQAAAPVYARASPQGSHLSSRSLAPKSSSLTGGASSATAHQDSLHWNAELASRADKERDAWARSDMHERRDTVTQSIWNARSSLRSALTYWPPAPPSSVTTIRCMYANIAQKSYGSEKRFLCPPPVVKVSGPLRPCKWVSMRVVAGDVPTPSGAGAPGSAAASTSGGEEPALLDTQGEARFGKLHVGSISDATSKVFRLQVNLLRADLDENRSGGNSLRAFHQLESPSAGPASHAWSTFHSSPINVISKPARKSVRTRAASPAIASGSIVCLYNRLNSQTVRTKYLGVETGTVEDVSPNVEVARKIVARQDGWEGFAIELLARPLNDPAVARANSRGLASDEWGITYGSIVCLRDVNSKLCSDPMLICKVDKGRVELSSVVGSTMEQEGRVRFQITAKNREEARQILFGGSRDKDSISSSPLSRASAVQHPSGATAAYDHRRETSEGGSSSDDSRNAASRASTGVLPPPMLDANSMVGGPVIQMQKVTLMHVTPLPSSRSPDEVECDLFAPRAYLCSTVSESSREELSRPALGRSQARLQTRSSMIRRGATHIPIDEANAPMTVQPQHELSPATPTPSHAVGRASASVSPFADGGPGTHASPVGYARPPTIMSDDYGVSGSRSGQVDVLEDQFCWTIVTISCTEVSFVEANAQGGSGVRAAYPHLSCTSLPVTPYPCLAALASYDARAHSIAATIYDFIYADATTQPSGAKMAHEVWLGHSGPLTAHASSAGPHMSDVTISLPGMEQLLTLHAEFNNAADTATVSDASAADDAQMIRLPLLFVRVAQGITFPSGHWLVAERVSMTRDRRSPSSWYLRIV